MTYLDVARAVVTGCEKSEISEISPGLLIPDEVESLKARIIAVVTVDPLDFDREEYDRLWERMHAHVDAGGAA